MRNQRKIPGGLKPGKASAPAGRKPPLRGAGRPGHGDWRGWFFGPALAVLLIVSGGCRTNPGNLFTASGPGWHVQQGQALWRPKSGLPEFGGDLVVARDDAGRCLIEFDKTPVAILSAQTTSNRWLIKFPQRDQGFSGSGAGSTRFGWLYLPAALAGKPLPKNFRFEQKPDGGWRLENVRTGETLEGFLAP